MKNLIKTIQNTAFHHALWQKGAKLVLGVSGGPDSVCLLDIMSKIAPKADLQLIIAHINYGLRGKDSVADEKFVRQLADKYGIKIKVLVAKDKKVTEESLRNVRYAFFEKVRKQNNFDAIAVAHNAADQVETFLMRVIRGAGLHGLSAMKYKNGNIIRPLLEISRRDILEYLKKNNLKYRIDRTNSENLFLRNKVRNNLIPYLRNNFNPNIQKTIFNATLSIAEDADFLSLFSKELTKEKTMSVKKLLVLHPALQRRVLLHYVKNVKLDLKDINSGHIEEMLKALRSTKGKNQIVSLKGLKMARKGDKVIISSN